MSLVAGSTQLASVSRRRKTKYATPPPEQQHDAASNFVRTGGIGDTHPPRKQRSCRLLAMHTATIRLTRCSQVCYAPGEMGLYDRYVLPRLINLACSSKPNMKQREKLVPLAEGDVLEIGMGSGLNLPYYDTGKVQKVWGLEPSEGMRRLARRRLGDSTLNLEMIDLPGAWTPTAWIRYW